MKKILPISILCALLLFPCARPFAQIVFQHGVGTAGNETAQAVTRVADGYVLAGSWSDGTSKADMWAVKLDLAGNVVWSKTYGTAMDDRAYSMARTRDGGLVLAGSSTGATPSAEGGPDVCITKLDSNGVWLWSKVYQGDSSAVARSIKETVDGGLVVCGYTRGNGAGVVDMFLLRTDSMGSLSWARAYGRASAKDTAFSVIEASTGEFVLAGHSDASGNVLAAIVKTGVDGRMLWSAEYDFSSHTVNKRRRAFGIIEDDGGGYVACGSVGLGSAGDASPFLLKADTGGAVLWGYHYVLNSGNNGAVSLMRTMDNGYIMGGFRGNSQAALVKTDGSGQRQWSKCYTRPLEDSMGASVVPSADGGYALVGNLRLAGGALPYVIKTNPMGTSGCDNCATDGGTGTSTPVVTMRPTLTVSTIPDVREVPVAMTEASVITRVTKYCTTAGMDGPTPITFVTVHPNPFTTRAMLRVDPPLQGATLTILDAMGRTVRQVGNVLGDTVGIDREDLPSGSYLLLLIDGDGTAATAKFVVTDP